MTFRLDRLSRGRGHKVGRRDDGDPDINSIRQRLRCGEYGESVEKKLKRLSYSRPQAHITAAILIKAATVQVASLRSFLLPIWNRHRSRRLYATQQFAFYDQMDWRREICEA